jgi:hypothetical protein
MTKNYNSTGIVLGNYWGGGKGSFAATKFSSNISKEDLIEQNKKALENGSLDSGMGYESLIGALITIKTTSTIIYEGKEFINDEYEDLFIGNLTEEEQEFLNEVKNYG